MVDDLNLTLTPKKLSLLYLTSHTSYFQVIKALYKLVLAF